MAFVAVSAHGTDQASPNMAVNAVLVFLLFGSEEFMPRHLHNLFDLADMYSDNS